MPTITKITWNNTNFSWNNAEGDTNYSNYTGHTPYTWNEVFLVEEIIETIQRGGGNIEDDMPWMKPEKKKKLIKLILKVKGETLTESKTKPIKQYKIKAKDVRLVIKEVSGVELTTENVSF